MAPSMSLVAFHPDHVHARGAPPGDEPDEDEPEFTGHMYPGSSHGRAAKQRRIEMRLGSQDDAPLREMSPENGPCTACGCTCGEAQIRGRGVRGSGSTTLSSRVLGNILREHPAPNSLIHFTVELCLGSCNHPFSDAHDLADSVCARSKWPVRIVTGVDASTSPCHRELGGHRANGWREKGRL